MSSGISAGDLLVAIRMSGYNWGLDASLLTHRLNEAIVRGSGKPNET